MNNRALSLSLVTAAIAVFFVYSYVSSIEEAAKKKYGSEVVVIVAKQNIKEMDTIYESMLDHVTVPKRYLEPSAIYLDSAKDEDITRTSKGITGTVALVAMIKGEQVSYNKITSPGLKTGLAPQITPGKRAISIPVGEITGVSKLVKPGDRVDIIAVVDGGDKTSRIAKTVLQDIVVLSIGRYITNNVARAMEADAFGGKDKVRSLVEDFTFSSVTIEVEPAQAQAVALLLAGAGENGLYLSLRNNDDSDRSNQSSTALTDVLGSDAGRVMKAQGAAPPVRR